MSEQLHELWCEQRVIPRFPRGYGVPMSVIESDMLRRLGQMLTLKMRVGVEYRVRLEHFVEQDVFPHLGTMNRYELLVRPGLPADPPASPTSAPAPPAGRGT